MTDWLTTKQRETLRRRLDELPDLATLAEAVAVTLLPRKGVTGGRSVPGSRPPVNVALVDALDERQKTPTRDWRNRWLEVNHRNPADDPRRVHNEHLQPDEMSRLAVELGDGARRGMLPTLGQWVRLAEGEMRDEGQECTNPAEKPTVTTEAGWLAMHLDWIVQRQWVTELADDVRRMHRGLSGIIGEGRPEYRPHCPGCRARMDDEGAYFTCPDCGQQVRDSAMDLRTSLAREKPMDAYSFAMFGVTPEAIRKWVERGLLTQATDDNGAPILNGKRHTFWPIDVLRLADSG